MASVIQNLYGGLTGGGTPNEQQAFDRDVNEGNTAQDQGNALQAQTGGLVNQFGNEYTNQTGLQNNYRGQADTAFQQLQQTPGYTDAQTAAIAGNPNAAFNYYDPNQLHGDVSGYQGNLNTAAQQGQQYLQAAPNNEMNWQGGINSQLQQSGNQAVGQLQGAEGSAVQGYGTNLNNAVDPSQLTVGSQLNGYQLSPEEAQNIRNVAAQATNGQYNKMSAQAQMEANAQGNTSPAALAAIQSQLGRQGAIDAGNAASTAELNANNAAAQRQLTATQTNLGANQTLAQLQQSNATNLYGAQANAANTIYGAQSGTAQNLANTQAQGVRDISGNQLSAATQQANLGYNAAQTGGAQKIATDTGLQQTGQGLATGADNASSNRATTTANQAITGQNTYRNYLTGQQGAAQTGQQTAGSQQLSAQGGQTAAYGAQQGAVNNANAAAGNVAVGANSTSQNLTGSFLADGGTFNADGVQNPEVVGLDKPKRYGAPDISRYAADRIGPGDVSGGSSQTSVKRSSSGGSGGGSDPYYGNSGTGGNSTDPFSSIFTGMNDGYGTGTSDNITGTSTSSIDYGDEAPPKLDYNESPPGDLPIGSTDWDPETSSYYDPWGQHLYYGDGGSSDTGTDAVVGERGPEAVISKPSRYGAVARGAVNAIGSVLGGGQHQPMWPMSAPPMTPTNQGSSASQPVSNPPAQKPVQPTWKKAANMATGALTGGKLQPFADGGMVSSMRGDGSAVPGNEPGGAQGRYGWQGMASRQMAAQPIQPPQGQSMQVFNSPTHVQLGTNGTTDTVVPLNPGPNAKVLPSQMGLGSAYRQSPPQAAQQQQAPMPSRYRPATGQKGMVGPQMRPMQPQNQYAA